MKWDKWGLIPRHPTHPPIIAVRSLRNIIVCKITAQPRDPVRQWHKDRGESCNLLSLERELEPRLDGLDESTRFTPLNNFFIPHNTWNNNTQQEVPSSLGVLALALAKHVEGNKGLCRETASNEASKKTSLTWL
jgi:hypothetical protein